MITFNSPRWIFALIATAILGVPLSAQANKIVANADFVNTSTDGCIDTEVNVFVKGVQIGKKARSRKIKVTLNITQIDICQDRVLVSAEAKNIKLKSKTFTVNNGKAILKTNIEMLNRQTKNKFMADILVHWDIEGSPVNANVTSDAEAPGKFVKLPRKTRKTLYFTNASGSITDGSNDFIKNQAEEASFTVTR